MATALVTGASRGIGRAVALALARDGHDVAVAYASNAAAAEEAAAAIRALGRRAVTCGADLADPAAADALVDAVEAGLGPVEVLVANAGANTPGRRVEEIALEEWDRLHAVNLRAPFLLARRVLPGMERRGFGRIVLLSSVAAHHRRALRVVEGRPPRARAQPEPAGGRRPRDRERGRAGADRERHAAGRPGGP